MTEIAQFRERAAKREREKMRDNQAVAPNIVPTPQGPKQREWGKPQAGNRTSPPPQTPQGFGRGAQGYSKPPAFIKAEDGGSTPVEDRSSSAMPAKTDEELEAERKEARKKDEENSFRDVSMRFPCTLW